MHKALKDNPLLPQRLSRTALGAAAFAVPLVLLPASTSTTLPKLLTMVVMSGTILLLFAWRLAGSGADSRGAGWPLLALLVAVPFYILVRVLWGTVSDMAEIRLLLVASGCLGLASMTVLLEGRLRTGAAWMVLLGGVSGLAVSVLTGLGAMDWLGAYPAASHRLSGSFGNANLLGSWAGPSAPGREQRDTPHGCLLASLQGQSGAPGTGRPAGWSSPAGR